MGPSPRARGCGPDFLTLGRRRTPAPLWAPAAPSPLGAPAPFKPSSQAPRHAPPAARVPYLGLPALSLSRRHPNPPRGVGDRVGVSPLLTKQRSRRRRRAKSLARARPPRPPPQHTPPAPPLRAHSPPPFPPPVASSASATRPTSCARLSALPLPACVHVRPTGGEKWAGPRGSTSTRRALPPFVSRRPCACALVCSSSASSAYTRSRACAEWVPLRRLQGRGGGGLGGPAICWK